MALRLRGGKKDPDYRFHSRSQVTVTLEFYGITREENDKHKKECVIYVKETWDGFSNQIIRHFPKVEGHPSWRDFNLYDKNWVLIDEKLFKEKIEEELLIKVVPVGND